MKKNPILVLYHSGVGNTRFVAGLIRQELDIFTQTAVASIEEPQARSLLGASDFLVLGFPTYHAAPSESIHLFIEGLPRYEQPKYAFTFTTCGLYPANSLRILAKFCQDKNIIVLHSAAYRAPATDGALLAPCIKWFHSFPKGLRGKVQADVSIAWWLMCQPPDIVRLPPFKWYAILNYPNKMVGQRYYKPQIHVLAPYCTGCGLCAERCPRNCFESNDGKANWQHDLCEHCYRCIHHCPCAALTLRKRKRVAVQFDDAFYEETVGKS